MRRPADSSSVSALLVLVMGTCVCLLCFMLGWVSGAVRVRRRGQADQRSLERLQDQFISTVSHELRTPLTSINGSLGLLTAGLLERQPERAERMLRIAADNADRLARLVDDVLDVERLALGRTSLQIGSCSPRAVATRAVESMRELAQRQGIELVLDAADADIELAADGARLEQVLRNLIDNALKFSPASTTVHVRLETSAKDVRFSVRDRGQGIAADKLPVIFGRFQQADMSDARRAGGVGLGLAIGKSVVDAHGGLIGAHSDGEGAGSTFWFVIPR